MSTPEQVTPAGDASWRRPLKRSLRAVLVGAAGLTVAVAVLELALKLVFGFGYTTDVTISLSYVGDDGRLYACTYDYSTPDDARMPPAIAAQMNARDWSGTGQRIYEWAKSHRAAEGSTWGPAMDEFVRFPPWQVPTPTGSTYALWWEARPGSTCEDGLR